MKKKEITIEEIGYIKKNGERQVFVGKFTKHPYSNFQQLKEMGLISYRINWNTLYLRIYKKPNPKQMETIYKIGLKIEVDYWDKNEDWGSFSVNHPLTFLSKIQEIKI